MTYTPPAPRKVVKPAEPGQAPNTGRFFSKTDLDPDYAEAAPVAFGMPKYPILVHEWDLPDADEDRDLLEKAIATEITTTLRLLNAADRAGELKKPDDIPAPDGPSLEQERFQVSRATSAPEKMIRTYIAFHPEGRPIRTRRTGAAAAGDVDLEVEEDGSGEALPEIDPENPERTAPAIGEDVEPFPED
jgi:hypothetical protein